MKNTVALLLPPVNGKSSQTIQADQTNQTNNQGASTKDTSTKLYKISPPLAIQSPKPRTVMEPRRWLDTQSSAEDMTIDA